MRVAFDISGEAVRDFLARSVPEGTAATAWPTNSPADAGPAAVVTAMKIRHPLRHRGAVVVGLPPDLGDHAMTVAGWNLLTLLGTPIPQYDTGELVYTVQLRPNADDASHYSATASGGNLHTDGSLLERAPDLAVLLCLSAASHGGETALVATDEVASHLEVVAPAGWAQLCEAMPYAAKDDVAVRQRVAVVTSADGGGTRLRYLRRYLDRGLALDGTVPDDDLVNALDAVDAYALDEANQETYALARGQMLIWDNASYLHGRRAFRQTGVVRRLVRMYAVNR